ncbi:MAG: DUF3581 family protein [Bermanella sp.]
MLLAPFYDEKNGLFSVSRQQGSDFAKSLANDFNPLHDVDAKRFVVPGDLLFSLTLKEMGISEKMRFEFVGMVAAASEFTLVAEGSEQLSVICGEKPCTKIQRSGEILSDAKLIEAISLEYVKFSGKTFPAILLPLMQQENVMVNPARPMVMYQSMVIELHDMAFSNPSIELAKQEINVDGKRGDVAIHFNILAAGKVVGCGEKNFLISGLRAYEADAMAALVKNYEATKAAYQAS